VSPVVKEWSKWEDSAEEYGYFSEWLHSADYTTVLRTDAFEWAKEKGYDVSRILGLVVKWHWESRAKAYDAWRAMQPLVKVVPLFSHMAEMMHKICTEELRRMLKAQEETKDIQTNTMKHRDIIRMAEQIRKTEEFCLEMMERRKEAIDRGEAYDFTKLSVDELRAMEDLSEKAKVIN
jgi:hypothetical protein